MGKIFKMKNYFSNIKIKENDDDYIKKLKELYYNNTK